MLPRLSAAFRLHNSSTAIQSGASNRSALDSHPPLFRRAEAEIVRVWNNLIDPNIIAHAQPTGLNKGTLFVTVDSSVWLNEIVRYRRKEVLDRLQHSFGSDLIARISFRVG